MLIHILVVFSIIRIIRFSFLRFPPTVISRAFAPLFRYNEHLHCKMPFSVFYLKETTNCIFMRITTYMRRDKHLQRANRVLGDQKNLKSAGGVSPCPGAHCGDGSFWTGYCSFPITNLNLLLRREAERMLKRILHKGTGRYCSPVAIMR